MEETTLRITTGGTTYEKFMEALSNVPPVYEYCDDTRTGIVYRDYQRAQIETSDGTIDGYIAYVDSVEKQHS